MRIAIIGPDEKADGGNFVIREINPNNYKIEESGTLIELASNNDLIVTTIVVDSIGSNPPKAKVVTKEYRYRTKSNTFLKFTQVEETLKVEEAM
jgi:hypothetical protein